MINKKRAKIQFELEVKFGDSEMRTWPYSVDWDTMEQINLATGARRPLERVILNQTTEKRGVTAMTTTKTPRPQRRSSRLQLDSDDTTKTGDGADVRIEPC